MRSNLSSVTNRLRPTGSRRASAERVATPHRKRATAGRSSAARRAPLERVLVPTDFSPGAHAAVFRVALLPLAPGAVVEVLHVLGTDHPREIRIKLEADARNRLKREAAAIRRAARNRGRADLRVRVLATAGQPFVEIVRRSRTMDAELIVLGRRGRGTLRDLVTARRRDA